MKLKLTIELDNDAFADEPMSELARILRDYAYRIEQTGEPSRALRDINGNVVGGATLFGGE